MKEKRGKKNKEIVHTDKALTQNQQYHVLNEVFDFE
jgi:hypothetical protein